MKWSSKVDKIDLPEAGSEVNPGTSLIVSGYGLVVDGGPTSPTLRKLNTTVITLYSCEEQYSKLLNTNLCTQRGKNYTVCTVS